MIVMMTFRGASVRRRLLTFRCSGDAGQDTRAAAYTQYSTLPAPSSHDATCTRTTEYSSNWSDLDTQLALYLSCLQISLAAFTYFFFPTKSLQAAKWLLGVDKRRVKRRECVDGCSFC
jgi:hypothetical protein